MNCVHNLVTVIIPTYNRAGIITRVLDSVWSQTYRPIELIVVNDGSPDNTEEVVSSWILAHNNAQDFTARLITQVNAGGCAARNNGLTQARGEFIQFFDDDDELLPSAFENHVCNLRKHPDVYCSLAQAIYISSKSKSFTHFNQKTFIGSDSFARLLENLPSPSFILFRQEFLSSKQIEWDTSLPCGQDTDFMIVSIIRGLSLAVTQEYCCKIYFHAGVRVTQKLRNDSFKLNQGLLIKWICLCKELKLDNVVVRKAFSHFFFAWLKSSAIQKNLETFQKYVLLSKETCCDDNIYVKIAQNHSMTFFLITLLPYKFWIKIKSFYNLILDLKINPET